jgi:hypothetical protein
MRCSRAPKPLLAEERKWNTKLSQVPPTEATVLAIQGCCQQMTEIGAMGLRGVFL